VPLDRRGPLGATNLALDNWAIPIGYHIDQTPAPQASIWTGSRSGAVSSGADCTGWSAASAFGTIAIFADELIPTYDGNGVCSVSQNLLCIQVGGPFFGQKTFQERPGKRVFVSKGTLTGAMSFGANTGIGAADALCQSEASDAGYLNASRFRAYLSTSADDALCHVLGTTGKVLSKCGLSELSTSEGWSRSDGFSIGPASEIAKSRLVAPILLAADQTRRVSASPWTGTTANGLASDTCNDWTSGDILVDSVVGVARGTSSGWTNYLGASCNMANPVYCFEH
jgi:hypothetical protein